MNIAITGSRGLLGSALTLFLTGRGHRVIGLVRATAGTQGNWNPSQGLIDPERLGTVHAVVHLAGENIAAGRWTSTRKAAIRTSRVDATRALAESLARLRPRPAVLVSASAVGFYGHRRAELLTEDSAKGAGFLADVCEDWEAATGPAAQAGMRVVQLRFGMVLSAAGGALAKMLMPFRLGVGGRIGSGKQFMSWISIEDAVGAIHHALSDQALRGPVNVVAPEPVSNAEFTRTLARALRRPALVPLPAFAARLAFGEMADALLLSSTRVMPARLQAHGFAFQFPALAGALEHLVGTR